MEIEQVIKRLDWLEDEFRKDRSEIDAVEERLVVLEGNVAAANQTYKELNGELTRITAVLGRVDKFESDLGQQRLEVNRTIDEIEKHRAEREREIEEVHRTQLEGVNSHIIELRKSLDMIPKLDAGLQARIDEDYRLSRLIDEVKQRMQDMQREDEERIRSHRLLDEGQRRDSKRLTDLQGEVVALRKRLDEQRGKLDLSTDSMRKVEVRVNELGTLLAERQETQAAFMEKQSLKDVERDRVWKGWEARFETVEKQTVELDSQLQGLEEARRSVKRAQETVETITERMERRINEITEMQRLAEERFRQEWVTFKADDQKRWTNYSLNQEEQYRESSRQLTKVTEQLTQIDDQLQEMRDTIHQQEEQIEKRLQSLLALTRDWVAEYERVFGRPR
jgi:chromosome segregation ATPase